MGLWWFMLPVLAPDVLRCIQLTEAISAMIEAERPTRIRLVDVVERRPYPLRLGLDANLPGKIAVLVSRSRGVAVCGLKAPARRRWTWRSRYWCARVGMKVYFACVRPLIARYRVWLTAGRQASSTPGGAGTVALVSSPVYWRQTVDGRGEQVCDDAIAGNCMRALGERGYDLLGIDVDLGSPNLRQFDVLRQKRARDGMRWRAIECFNGKPAGTARRRRLEALGREAGEEAVRHRGMPYSGLDLAPLLAGRFAYLFDRFLEDALGYLDALEDMMASEKIDLAVIVYEEGPAGRAATIAGQRQQVPTLALQHGTLSSPYAPAYYLPAVAAGATGDPEACPIPDLTAVYGAHTRSMLVESSVYPADSVAAVGMPASDGIVELANATTPEQARRKLGLAEEGPLVLVVSQPFFNRENRDYFASEVLAAAGRVSEAAWAVKLHPSEEAGAWRHYIEGSGVGMREFRGDLHLLLSACDVVVSWYSTVIIEAVLFARPVISVNIPGCLAPEDYRRDGLVVQAGDATDIERQIRVLWRGGERREGQLHRGIKGVEKHVHKPNEAASERVADLVEALAREGRIKRKKEKELKG
ncbi:MAG: hypothetical protein VX293_02860 [Candidatus Latescibacterota bacterium]|nr:hypothetical protein [Candidatus Latescibacterota bacterium]